MGVLCFIIGAMFGGSLGVFVMGCMVASKCAESDELPDSGKDCTDISSSNGGICQL